MERLIERYDITMQALNSLDDALDLLKKYELIMHQKPSFEIEREYKSHRDSAIKRFEYTLDTCWKYLKFFLESRIGVVHNSPKPIFRECFKNKFMDESETIQALEMIDARNLTSHIYKEETAETICSKIPHYALLIRKILITMAP